MSVALEIHATEPALNLDPALALHVLEDVERLAYARTGALVYRSAQQHDGLVLVERGRVCWAVARPMKRRLTDLITRHATPAVDGGL